MASGPLSSWEIDGETVEAVRDFIFGVSKSTADGDWSHEIKRCLLLRRKVMTHLDSILKSRDINFANKHPSSQSCGFSSYVWMWELDCKESWVPKNWCFWSVVLEKTLQSPLDCREIQSILKEINSGYSIEGLMLKLKLPILWPPDVKDWLIWEDPDDGKDWRQEEKGTTEDEMVGWHHGLNGREFEQAPRVRDGQGSLVCYSPWGHKESDTTEPLNWTDFCLEGSGLIWRQSLIWIVNELLSAWMCETSAYWETLSGQV